MADGLGTEIARIFSQAGYDVIGLSRTNRAPEPVRTLVEQGGGNYIRLACDLARPEEVSAALRTHAERIDVLNP